MEFIISADGSYYEIKTELNYYFRCFPTKKVRADTYNNGAWENWEIERCDTTTNNNCWTLKNRQHNYYLTSPDDSNIIDCTASTIGTNQQFAIYDASTLSKILFYQKKLQKVIFLKN